MKGFKERLERIKVEEPVHIPTLDGTGIAETVKVKVPAWRDPKDGEIYLDPEATAILDKVKARHMGLLTPEQIKALRKRLGLTQPQISELLQIGEKTWTRWETGRERPSRSINVLLFALKDGKLDVAYLRSVARRRNDWASQLAGLAVAAGNPWLATVQEIWRGWQPQADRELAQAIQEAFASFLMSRINQGDFGFRMEGKVTAAPSLPGNMIQVRPLREAGQAVEASEPSVSNGPRFVIPDEALVA